MNKLVDVVTGRATGALWLDFPEALETTQVHSVAGALAHNGLLFLDELPEFPRNVLGLLGQPLEDDAVTLASSQLTPTFPARFMLVAAMNPCPCGFHGDTTRECRCTGGIIQRYLGKISGPLLGHILLYTNP